MEVCGGGMGGEEPGGPDLCERRNTVEEDAGLKALRLKK